MTRSQPAGSTQSDYLLSNRLIKGLENACVVLVIFTVLLSGFGLFLIYGDPSTRYLNLPDRSAHISSEFINAASGELAFEIFNSIGIVSAVLGVIIDMCFSIVLFLTLRGLLSSLRHRPTAADIAIGLRRIALLTLVWPVAALVGQILGGYFSAVNGDNFVVDLSFNYSMLATGLAIWIGCLATQKLAKVEQELEAVI